MTTTDPIVPIPIPDEVRVMCAAIGVTVASDAMARVILGEIGGLARHWRIVSAAADPAS